MKQFEKQFNNEIRPYIHNPADKNIGKYWWKAALEMVLTKVETSNSDGSIIQYIKDELKS